MFFPYLLHSARLSSCGIVNFATLKPALTIAVTSLTQLIEKDGEQFAKCATWCTELETAGVSFTRSDHDIQVYKRMVGTPYLEALVSALEKRFPLLPCLSALEVFQPSRVPVANTHDLAEHGCQELTTLLDAVSDADTNFVNADEARQEFRHLKSAIKVCDTLQTIDNAAQFMATIQTPRFTELRSEIPNLLRLADWRLALPLSSVECERDFSRMKLIKTPLRNRLKNTNLSRLIWISVDGPPISEYPFEEALLLWHQVKQRRLRGGQAVQQALLPSATDASAALGADGATPAVDTPPDATDDDATADPRFAASPIPAAADSFVAVVDGAVADSPADVVAAPAAPPDVVPEDDAPADAVAEKGPSVVATVQSAGAAPAAVCAPQAPRSFRQASISSFFSKPAK